MTIDAITAMKDKAVMEEIEAHISAISSLLGIPVTESNKDTPRRVAKMYYNELFKNRNFQNLDELRESMTVFSATDSGNQKTPIVLQGIRFNSVCEHHWLPFIGTATVSYVPKDTIIGLSKIPRVVKYFSQMPQLQEKLTSDIGKFLVEVLDPECLTVELVATHTCVMCRGAESACETRTLYHYIDEEE